MEENNVVTMPLESSNEAIDTTQETTQQPAQEVKQETPQTFKVKHLHEQKEISFDDAPTYIQKGLDYDRVKQKYEDSKPVLTFVERLAQQNGLTVPEYLKAVEDYERQQEIEELAQRNSVNPELAEELYLLRQERKQREMQAHQHEVQAKQNQEYIDFLNQFPDVKPENIPQEVWQMKANTGISITDAYIRHEYNSLKSKINAQETNVKNADASTGSVTGNGDTPNNYISYESFQKNKNDRDWIIKNFTAINDSRKRWK